MFSDADKQPEKGRVYMGIGGRKVYLDRPVPSDFNLYQTAYALSHINRFAGNYGAYSVAQHACLVAATAARLGGSRMTLLAALHHDDAESITGDLPQPVKSLCPAFKELELRLDTALTERYGIMPRHDLVKHADRIVFCAEVRCLVPQADQHLYGEFGDPEYRRDVQPTQEDLILWSPDQARKTYLAMHESLERMGGLP